MKGVAYSLLGAFVSRNNDVGGYWSMGRLYAHARSRRVDKVTIDLGTGRMEPDDPVLATTAIRYREMLQKLMAADGLPPGYLGSASIAVLFNDEASAPERYESAPIGDAYTATVELVDDRRIVYLWVTSGRCWPHDPNREMQSGWPVASF